MGLGGQCLREEGWGKGLSGRALRWREECFVCDEQWDWHRASREERGGNVPEVKDPVGKLRTDFYAEESPKLLESVQQRKDAI